MKTPHDASRFARGTKFSFVELPVDQLCREL